MNNSKWYLVNGQSKIGNYTLIKEEETDLIVAEFPAVKSHEANERAINLKSIVDEHNEVVKLLKKAFYAGRERITYPDYDFVYETYKNWKDFINY